MIAADDAVALAATRGAEMAKACATEPCLRCSAALDRVLVASSSSTWSRGKHHRRRPDRRAGRLTALEKLAEAPPARR